MQSRQTNLGSDGYETNGSIVFEGAMIMLEPIVLPLVFITVVVETILSSFWINKYFKSGIKIFDESYSLRTLSKSSYTAQNIENLLPASKYQKFIFKHSGKNVFFFKEKLLSSSKTNYSPLMRGILHVDKFHGNIKIVGLLNWSILSFGVLSISAPFIWSPDRPLVFGFPVFFIVISIIIYKIQAKRFKEIGMLISKN